MNTTVDTYLAINGWSNATNGSDTAKKNELKQNVTDAQSKIKKLETDIATYYFFGIRLAQRFKRMDVKGFRRHKRQASS